MIRGTCLAKIQPERDRSKDVNIARLPDSQTLTWLFHTRYQQPARGCPELWIDIASVKSLVQRIRRVILHIVGHIALDPLPRLVGSGLPI